MLQYQIVIKEILKVKYINTVQIMQVDTRLIIYIVKDIIIKWDKIFSFTGVTYDIYRVRVIICIMMFVVLLLKILEYLLIQKIDSYNAQWNKVYDEMIDTNLNRVMTGNQPISPIYQTASSNNEYIFNIPLKFWFNRNPGLALPVIALKNSQVRIEIDFDSLSNVIQDPNVLSALTGQSHKVELYGQYIYLGNNERRRFNTNKHDYLIEQVQYNSKRMGDVASGQFVGKKCSYIKN